MTRNFDEWLSNEVKQNLLQELDARCKQATEGNCVCVAATEKRNIDTLRKVILDKVHILHEQRYPHQTKDFY